MSEISVPVNAGVPFQGESTEVHSSTPVKSAAPKTSAQWITLDEQQAAQFFRTLGLRSCQYEQGRMRWWLSAGLRIELSDAGHWTLWVVPTRGALTTRDSQDPKEA